MWQSEPNQENSVCNTNVQLKHIIAKLHARSVSIYKKKIIFNANISIQPSNRLLIFQKQFSKSLHFLDHKPQNRTTHKNRGDSQKWEQCVKLVTVTVIFGNSDSNNNFSKTAASISRKQHPLFSENNNNYFFQKTARIIFRKQQHL